MSIAFLGIATALDFQVKRTRLQNG